MRALIFASLALFWTLVGALQGVNEFADRSRARKASTQNVLAVQEATVIKAEAPASPFLNSNTTKFSVNGTGIPDVDWDAGESYAGQLPVGGKSDGQLFFWFWPTTNTSQPKEIIIWLNGGPGCSSLEGFLQENGPISWQSGTYKPVKNTWSWHQLTNIIYVEQPIGTGFSTGTPTANGEEDLAQQFLGFWKNFVDTFGIHGYKVYITGESYAGMYCPYISKAFLDTNDTDYYNLKGMSIYDPVINEFVVSEDIPTRYMVDYWSNVFPFNDTSKAYLANMSQQCGYDDYINKYLTFPPVGPQPLTSQLPGITNTHLDCSLFDKVNEWIMDLNPGFNIYQVAQLTPIPYDVLGFPSSVMYIPPGQELYFNRADVKAAIHAPPNVNWTVCSDANVFPNGDNSDPSSFVAIPSVIDRTGNVLISHGMNDFVLIPNGTLLGIQNMTWGGKLGFQNIPADPLFVPFHVDPTITSASGQGVLGTTHQERGLTWSLIMLTGHMVPGWQAAVAFRQVEVLLGRVSNLSSTQPFAIFPNAKQPDASTLGKGTAPVLGTVAGANGGNQNSSGSGTGSGSGSKSFATSSRRPSGDVLWFWSSMAMSVVAAVAFVL